MVLVLSRGKSILLATLPELVNKLQVLQEKWKIAARLKRQVVKKRMTIMRGRVWI